MKQSVHAQARSSPVLVARRSRDWAYTLEEM